MGVVMSGVLRTQWPALPLLRAKDSPCYEFELMLGCFGALVCSRLDPFTSPPRTAPCLTSDATRETHQDAEPRAEGVLYRTACGVMPPNERTKAC